MHFSYTRPGGNWTDGVDALTEIDLESFEAKMFKAINGDEGGSWAPSAAIVIGGSGITFQGANHNIDNGATITMEALGTIESAGLIKVDGATAEIRVGGAGGAINVNAGGAININTGGDLDIETGGQLDVKSGGAASIKSGATLAVDLGGGFFCAGGCTIQGAANHIYFDTRTHVRSYHVTGVVGGWQRKFTGLTEQTVNVADRCIIDLPIPTAHYLKSVEARIIGGAGHVGLPAAMPVLELWKRNISSGALTSLGSATDAAGSIAAYEGQHFVKVTLAGPGELIDRATYCYFATVQGEAGANAIAGLVCNGALVTTDVAILDEAV